MAAGAPQGTLCIQLPLVILVGELGAPGTPARPARSSSHQGLRHLPCFRAEARHQPSPCPMALAACSVPRSCWHHAGGDCPPPLSSSRGKLQWLAANPACPPPVPASALLGFRVPSRDFSCCQLNELFQDQKIDLDLVNAWTDPKRCCAAQVRTAKWQSPGECSQKINPQEKKINPQEKGSLFFL